MTHKQFTLSCRFEKINAYRNRKGMSMVSRTPLSHFSFKTAPVNYQSAAQNAKGRAGNETPSGRGQAAAFTAQAPLFAGFTLWRRDPSQALSEQVRNASDIRKITQGSLKAETLKPVIDPELKDILPDAAAIQKLLGKNGSRIAPAVYGQAITQVASIGRIDILRILLEHANLQAIEAAAPALEAAIRFRSHAIYLNDMYQFKALMLDLLLSAGVNPTPKANELLSYAIGETDELSRYLENQGAEKRSDGGFIDGAYTRAIQEIRAALLEGEIPELFQTSSRSVHLRRLLAGLQDWSNAKRYLQEKGESAADSNIAVHIALLRRVYPWRPD